MVEHILVIRMNHSVGEVVWKCRRGVPVSHWWSGPINEDNKSFVGREKPFGNVGLEATVAQSFSMLCCRPHAFTLSHSVSLSLFPPNVDVPGGNTPPYCRALFSLPYSGLSWIPASSTTLRTFTHYYKNTHYYNHLWEAVFVCLSFTKTSIGSLAGRRPEGYRILCTFHLSMFIISV